MTARLCGGLLAGLLLLPTLGYADIPPQALPSRAEVAPTAVPTPAATPSAAPKADAEGFVPDSRPPNMTNVEEGMPAAPLVAGAYGFIWLAVLVFVAYTAKRAANLEGEIAHLAERIGSAEATSKS